MTSRVSQFDEMYAKGLEELEQVEQSSGEKKLYVLAPELTTSEVDKVYWFRQQMFNVFKTFLDDATRKPEEKPKDLMEILEPLEVRNHVARNLFECQTISFSYMIAERI